LPKWTVYKAKYYGFPDYTGRITGHYVGDMISMEEIGNLSEACTERMCGRETYIGTLYELKKDMIINAFGFKECISDREVLEKALREMKSGITILIQAER